MSLGLFVLALAVGCTKTEPETAGSAATGGKAGAASGGSGGNKGTGGTGGGAAGGTGGAAVGTGGSGTGGSSADASAPADAPGPAGIQLKMAWWGGADRAARTKQVVALFEAQNPGIKIATEFYATTQGMGIPGTDYWPTLNKYATDGTLPDIMQHDYAYIEEWTGRNLLRPLDQHMADGSLKLSDVPQGLIDGGKVGGKVMGISLGLNTQAMVIDVDVFTKHNIAIPTDEWTWEDFEKIALEIKAKEGIFGFGSGLWGYTPGWKAIYLSLGQWVFNGDGTALGYTDDKPWADHFSMIVRLRKAEALAPLALEPTGNVDTLLMVTKKSGMEHVFSNQLVALGTAANVANMNMPRNFKMLPLPKVKGAKSPIYMKPAQYFSITASSKHPKEAAKFIEFFTNDIEANKILGGERGVPVNTKVLAELKKTLTPIAAESFSLIERGGAYATKLPPNDPPKWTTLLNTIFTPIAKQVVDLKLTPEAAVAQFRLQATALLSGMPVPDGGVDGGQPGDGGADGGVEAGSDTGGDGGSEPRALLVVGAMPLEATDMAIQASLAKKMGVDIVLDTAATTESAAGKALVFITASASQAGVNTKFRDVKVPVILLEPNLMGDMGLTGTAVTDHGTVPAQTSITIVAPTNALAADLKDNVAVYSAAHRVVFGVPAAAATKIASVVGNAAQSAIFAYPAGTMMVGRMAAAKRLGFFVHNGAPALTANGTKLLDAAISWALVP